jgi:hypothetical protein
MSSTKNNNDLYGTPEARANTMFDPSAVITRITKCLKKSKDYWTTEINPAPISLGEYNQKFYDWLKEDYGLDVQFEEWHGTKGIVGYKIVDNQKFLMFMLKFQ